MDITKVKKNIIFILCAVVLSFGIVFTIKANAKEKNISNNIEKLEKNELDNKDEDSKKDSKKVYVDVKGAVKSPGVYLLDNTKIVMDAVNSAGGLEDSADTTYINLSKKLSDEMVIYIFTKDEDEDKKEEGEITYEMGESLGGIIKNDAYIDSSDTNNVKNNNITSDVESKKNTSEENKEEENKNAIININTASKDELMNLNGIGDVKAQNIINYRIDNGEFKSIEEIKNVSGIGDAIYEKIKNDICI